MVLTAQREDVRPEPGLTRGQQRARGRRRSPASTIISRGGGIIKGVSSVDPGWTVGWSITNTNKWNRRPSLGER